MKQRTYKPKLLPKARFWLLVEYLRFGNPDPVAISVAFSTILWGTYFALILITTPELPDLIGRFGIASLAAIGLVEIVIGVVRLYAIASASRQLRLVTLAIHGVLTLFLAILFVLTAPRAPVWWLYLFRVIQMAWLYVRLGKTPDK